MIESDEYDYDLSGEAEIEGEIRRETIKAVLLWDGKRDAWIPKSQVSYREDRSDGTCVLEIPEWSAFVKGLI